MHDPPFLCAFFDTVGLACEGLAVIRTSAPRLRFIASTGLNAELHQAVGRSPVLRGFEDFSFQTKPPAKPTNGGSAAPEVSRPMEHLSCSSVEAGRDASPAICWSGEKRAEGNPLHAFTSPDGVAVVLAPTESSVT